MEDANKAMTKEEEEEWESMVRQRRNARSGGFYGGAPPHPSTLEAEFSTKSSGISEPDCDKLFDKVLNHTTRFRIGYADTIGRRPTMEDEIRVKGKLRTKDTEDYVAIFDGHGGKDVSEYAAEHMHLVIAKKLDELANVEQALKQAFSELNEMIRSANKLGGSTALVAIFSEDKAYIANAGDSRAVLLKNNQTIALTVDHKPDTPTEEERIQNSGGCVTRVANKMGKTIARLNGMLAVSRALGDLFLQPHVTAEPEVYEFDLNANNQLLIMACDGVWDVLTNEETTELAFSEFDNPELGAIKIRDTALAKGSGDNISVIVIKFQNPVDRNRNMKHVSNIPPSTTTQRGWSKTAVTVGLIALIGLIGFAAVQWNSGRN